MALFKAIPLEYKKGYKELYEINDDEFISIADAINRKSLTSSPIQLANQIADEISVPKDKVIRILMSVGSVARYLEKDKTPEDIATELISAIKADHIDWKTEEDKEKFKGRLTTLLQTQQLFISSKAVELTTESGNVYIQSRVITDMRPIFNKNIEEPPQAAIITHTLHLHYRHDVEGDHRDMFFTLDSNDIQSLKEAIERAEKKEKNLQAVLKSAGIINLNE